jgi:predicted amidophosphoribosyltransferase
MTKYRHTEDEYRKAVEQSFTVADVCRILGILPRGGNYGTVQKKIVKYNLDASHFLGHAHNRGKTFIESPVGKHTIKKRVLAERGHRCESCKNTDWLGKPIALELEHIDGNNTNYIDSNLLLLCPNCHAQTPTWKRGKASFEINPKTVCPGCGEKKQPQSQTCKNCYIPKGANGSTTILRVKEPLLCSCGNAMSKGANQCSECLHKAQERIVWPAPEELATRLRTTSYTALGRELGVSDNAIRKYLRKHGYDTKSLHKVDTA